MGVFVILVFVPILIQHLMFERGSIYNEKRNKYALFVFFLFLTLLVALRHESVGKDTSNYIYFFERYADLEWIEFENYSREQGFVYLNKLISLFTNESQIYLASVAVITIAMIYPTYNRLCIDTSLTIVLFCIMSTFVMMFSGIRQMLAVGVGFIAYEFVRRMQIIPFAICVLIAMTFHMSAFMIAFMYPIYHTKITKKWLFVVILAIIMVFVFNEQIFSTLTALIEKHTEYDTTITQTGAYTMIILFAAFAIFAFVVPDESHMNREMIALRNFLLFSLVLQMFAPLHTVAMRMNYYYIIFIPLLLPKIIEYSREQWKQIALASRYIMIIFFLAYFFFTASGGGVLNVFQYHFFWEVI